MMDSTLKEDRVCEFTLPNIWGIRYCMAHSSFETNPHDRLCITAENATKKKLTSEDLKGMQGVPEVYISVTWTAITADQVEKVAKFAAELGVPFNMNMQDPIYGEDGEDDGELTHD